VREILDRLFAEAPGGPGYVLDEQGALRKHVTVFVDGETVQDRYPRPHRRPELRRAARGRKMAEGVGFEPTGRMNDRRFFKTACFPRYTSCISLVLHGLAD
jgi:hypothetical protein